MLDNELAQDPGIASQRIELEPKPGHKVTENLRQGSVVARAQGSHFRIVRVLDSPIEATVRRKAKQASEKHNAFHTLMSFQT